MKKTWFNLDLFKPNLPEEVRKIAQTLTDELLMRFICSSEDATERDG